MTQLAVVIGGQGGIGAALVDALEQQGHADRVINLSRQSEPPIDFTDLASVERAASWLAAQPGEIRLVIDATGFLHDGHFTPERSLRDLNAEHMGKAFLINAIGPAIVMQHILPLLPRDGRAVFATLSARVGSIADNRLGGWHSYRASKAALNQLVRGAAIELARRRKDAVCVALHPGTVDTPLSGPFSKSGLDVRPASQAAADILAVIDGLSEADSGGFFDHKGEPIAF